MPVDRISVNGVEDVVNQPTRDHGIEDDRNSLSCYFPRANSPESAFGSFATDCVGRLQLLQRARSRVPVISLHRGSVSLRNGYCRNRAVGAPILPHKTM